MSSLWKLLHQKFAQNMLTLFKLVNKEILETNWTRNSYFNKNWKNAKGLFWKLSNVFWFCTASPTKGFKEKNTVKNAWDRVSTALEFIQAHNYYSFLKPSYSFDFRVRCSQFKPCEILCYFSKFWDEPILANVLTKSHFL